MPARVKIDPEKLTHQVREIYELSLLKNLSPLKLAPILNVSAMQLYRWYRGDAPKPGSERLIELGLMKIRELPDFLAEGKASWGRLWIVDAERKRQEADEKRFDVQMTRLRDQLTRKAPIEELQRLDKNAEGDAWSVFEDVMFTLKKHGIKLPKIT